MEEKKIKPSLIYIMDPLCGWCFGNSETMLELFNHFKTEMDFDIIPGGMLTGVSAKIQSPQMAEYFIKHDRQINQLTGVDFGAAYFDFIKNNQVVLDSEIPSRAIITVQQFWPEQNIPFMVEVQRARYRDGKDLNLDSVYLEICKKFGIDTKEFLTAFHSDQIKTETLAAFQNSTRYASSYPTLLIASEGEIELLEQGYSSLGQITTGISNFLTHHYN